MAEIEIEVGSESKDDQKIEDSSEEELVHTSLDSFSKYQHIENLTNRILNILKDDSHSSTQDGPLGPHDPISQEQWVVTEKIHGSNFSFTTDGITIKQARRTDYLKDTENFYKSKEFATKLQEKILNLYKNCLIDFPELLSNGKILVIYGELCGGIYDNYPKTITAIQNEIKYFPYLDFYAFDIYLDGKCLNYNNFAKICEKSEIKYVKPLFIGKLLEAVEYSTTHYEDLTTIPREHNLPDIPGNIREGHVIKTVEYATFKNSRRAIIKHKNSKFNEKQPVVLVVEGEDPILEQYITEQRIHNVVSKFGKGFEYKNIGFIANEYVKDVKQDYETDNPQKLDKKQLDHVKRKVTKMLRNMIKDNPQNNPKNNNA